MSDPDLEVWHLAVEDPDALSQADWVRLERALITDPALRQRLVAERQLHDRLSRLHDAGRGDLGAALSHRLTHVTDHPRFVQRVLQRTVQRRRPVSRGRRLPRAAVFLTLALALALGLGFWCVRQPSEPHWISGPATVALVGGGSAELDREARWRDDAAPFLERGGATLEVAHRSAAPFVLRTPHAAITVLGTHFSVHVGEDTAVAVQRGLVRLDDPSGTSLALAVGERGRCAGGAVRRERVLFSSGFGVDEPASIVVGQLSPLDPDGRPDACVAAGSYPTDNGPRTCVSVRDPALSPVRCEPGMLVSFRWWAEPAVGAVLLQVWDENQQRNFVLELGTAQGQWNHVSVPITRLHPFAGLPQQDLRAQPGDQMVGVLLVGSAAAGRLYLDDVAFSVVE